MRAMMVAMILAAGAASCGPPPKLPDLPPPEYEKPRGYDLPGAQKPAPTAAPTAPPPAKP